jgi:hypothetical protein
MPEEKWDCNHQYGVSLVMPCFTAVIPLLVRSWNGDFHSLKKAVGKSKDLLGMREAWGKPWLWPSIRSKFHWELSALFQSIYPIIPSLVELNCRLIHSGGCSRYIQRFAGHEWGLSKSKTINKQSSLPSVTMICFTTVIPLLVVNWIGDILQESTGMSKGFWQERGLMNSKTINKKSSLQSVIMICLTTVIPLLVRSQTGDFHNVQEAAGKSEGLLGMREAWRKVRLSIRSQVYQVLPWSDSLQLSQSCKKQQGFSEGYWAWEKHEEKVRLCPLIRIKVWMINTGVCILVLVCKTGILLCSSFPFWFYRWIIS